MATMVAELEPLDATAFKTAYPSIELLGRVDGFIVNRACSHKWSFPQALKASIDNQTADKIAYPIGFDSHQTCPSCGTERFFNYETMTPGPLFRRRIFTPSIRMRPSRRGLLA